MGAARVMYGGIEGFSFEMCGHGLMDGFILRRAGVIFCNEIGL
jgi:hypothetical protein